MDKSQLLGAVLGLATVMGLIVWGFNAASFDMYRRTQHELHVACLSGGGVWQNGECRRP
jgi:hypothetical protein